MGKKNKGSKVKILKPKPNQQNASTPDNDPSRLKDEPKIYEVFDDEDHEPLQNDTESPEICQSRTTTGGDDERQIVEEKAPKEQVDVKASGTGASSETKAKVALDPQERPSGAQPKDPEAAKKADLTHPTGDCAACNRQAKSLCSGCKNVFYCSKDHQREHWNTTHKEECKLLAKLPYRVETNEVVGRHLVATKDIPQGQLILNESPFVCGPRQLSKPVCLGCHKELKDASSVVKCSRCHWPLCSRKCEDSSLHDPECRIIRYGGSKVAVDTFGQVNMMYACITVLRALALRDGPKKLWEDYVRFQSHLQDRMKTEVYTKVNKEKVVFFIQHFLRLVNRYSDLEILEACGRLDTNCFEIKQRGLNLRAMYRTACLMAHDCVPNTRHTFDPDNSINLYSTVNIAKGTPITATYTQSLWNTMNRRDHLKMSKCFWCTCRRCADPTELGAHLSTIICRSCGGSITSTDPLDSQALWRCGRCKGETKAEAIKDINDNLVEELRQTNRTDPRALDDFLKSHATLIPDTHQLAREIQYGQVVIFKSLPPDQMDTNALLKKSYLCKQLLDLADKIEPGKTSWRGQLLFEMQAASVVLTQRALEEGKLSRFQAQEAFQENLQHLKEAVAILQVEPEAKEDLQVQMKKLSDILQEFLVED